MINRHQELRRMSEQIIVGFLSNDMVIRGLANTRNGSLDIPILSGIVVRAAKTLQHTLDAECESAGHDYKYRKEIGEYMSEAKQYCIDCGKEKPQ